MPISEAFHILLVIWSSIGAIVFMARVIQDGDGFKRIFTDLPAWAVVVIAPLLAVVAVSIWPVILPTVLDDFLKSVFK